VNVTLVLATQRLPGPRTYGPLLPASALGGVAGGLVSHRITARIAMLPTVLLALARAVPADLVCG
jgi:hypothetical protein